MAKKGLFEEMDYTNMSQESKDEYSRRVFNPYYAGAQAFKESQKDNDTKNNTWFGQDLVDSAQANAAGVGASTLRGVNEVLDWAGEKVGLRDPNAPVDKDGLLNSAAAALDDIQRRNTQEKELTGIRYVGEQVGSIIGSMLALTAETAAADAAMTATGAAIGSVVPGLGTAVGAGAGYVASKVKNALSIMKAASKLPGASKVKDLASFVAQTPKANKVLQCAKRMWDSNYLENFYKLQMSNRAMEAFSQGGALIKELEDEGFARDEIRSAALWSGGINYAFLGVSNALGEKGAKMIGGGVADKILNNEMLQRYLSEPLRKGIANKVGKAAAIAAWQGVSEGAEEAGQDYIDQISKQLSQGTPVGEMSWEHTGPLSSFMGAATGSLVLGGLGGAHQVATEKGRKFSYNGHTYELDPSGTKWTIDGESVVNQKVTNEETGEITQEFMPYTAKDVANMLGEDVTEDDVKGVMAEQAANISNETEKEEQAKDVKEEQQQSQENKTAVVNSKGMTQTKVSETLINELQREDLTPEERANLQDLLANPERKEEAVETAKTLLAKERKQPTGKTTTTDNAKNIEQQKETQGQKNEQPLPTTSETKAEDKQPVVPETGTTSEKKTTTESKEPVVTQDVTTDTTQKKPTPLSTAVSNPSNEQVYTVRENKKKKLLEARTAAGRAQNRLYMLKETGYITKDEYNTAADYVEKNGVPEGGMPVLLSKTIKRSIPKIPSEDRLKELIEKGEKVNQTTDVKKKDEVKENVKQNEQPKPQGIEQTGKQEGDNKIADTKEGDTKRETKEKIKKEQSQEKQNVKKKLTIPEDIKFWDDNLQLLPSTLLKQAYKNTKNETTKPIIISKEVAKNFVFNEPVLEGSVGLNIDDKGNMFVGNADTSSFSVTKTYKVDNKFMQQCINIAEHILLDEDTMYVYFTHSGKAFVAYGDIDKDKTMKHSDDRPVVQSIEELNKQVNNTAGQDVNPPKEPTNPTTIQSGGQAEESLNKYQKIREEFEVATAGYNNKENKSTYKNRFIYLPKVNKLYDELDDIVSEMDGNAAASGWYKDAKKLLDDIGEATMGRGETTTESEQVGNDSDAGTNKQLDANEDDAQRDDMFNYMDEVIANNKEKDERAESDLHAGTVVEQAEQRAELDTNSPTKILDDYIKNGAITTNQMAALQKEEQRQIVLRAIGSGSEGVRIIKKDSTANNKNSRAKYYVLLNGQSFEQGTQILKSTATVIKRILNIKEEAYNPDDETQNKLLEHIPEEESTKGFENSEWHPRPEEWDILFEQHENDVKDDGDVMTWEEYIRNLAEKDIRANPSAMSMDEMITFSSEPFSWEDPVPGTKLNPDKTMVFPIKVKGEKGRLSTYGAGIRYIYYTYLLDNYIGKLSGTIKRRNANNTNAYETIDNAVRTAIKRTPLAPLVDELHKVIVDSIMRTARSSGKYNGVDVFDGNALTEHLTPNKLFFAYLSDGKHDVKYKEMRDTLLQVDNGVRTLDDYLTEDFHKEMKVLDAEDRKKINEERKREKEYVEKELSGLNAKQSMPVEVTVEEEMRRAKEFAERMFNASTPEQRAEQEKRWAENYKKRIAEQKKKSLSDIVNDASKFSAEEITSNDCDTIGEITEIICNKDMATLTKNSKRLSPVFGKYKDLIRSLVTKVLKAFPKGIKDIGKRIAKALKRAYAALTSINTPLHDSVWETTDTKEDNQLYDIAKDAIKERGDVNVSIRTAEMGARGTVRDRVHNGMENNLNVQDDKGNGNSTPKNAGESGQTKRNGLGGDSLLNDRVSAGGERNTDGVLQTTSGMAKGVPGNNNSRGSGRTGETGVPRAQRPKRGSSIPKGVAIPVRGNETNTGRAYTSTKGSVASAPSQLNGVKIDKGSAENVRKTFDYLGNELRDEQCNHVALAEKHLYQDGGRGVLCTDGTGFGKTRIGIATIMRALASGAKNILIVGPATTYSVWEKDAHKLGMDDKNVLGKNAKPIVYLDSKHGHNENQVSYASFDTLAGENGYKLINHKFDLIVVDEFQMTLQREDGVTDMVGADTITNRLRMLRTISGNHLGFDGFLRARHEEFDELDQIRETIKETDKRLDNTDDTEKLKILKEKRDKLSRKGREIIPKLQHYTEIERPRYDKFMEDRTNTKCCFFSATPFAYAQSTIMAEGFLFNIDDFIRVINWSNTQQAYSQYMKNMFGKNAITRKELDPVTGETTETVTGFKSLSPKEEFDLSVQFHDALVSTGAMFGEQKIPTVDFSRRFFNVPMIDKNGNKMGDKTYQSFIREGWEQIENDPAIDKNLITYMVRKRKFRDKGDGTEKSLVITNEAYIKKVCECAETEAAISKIKQSLDSGHSVVFATDTKQENELLHPFKLSAEEETMLKEKDPNMYEAYTEQYLKKYGELANTYIPTMRPAVQLRNAFGKDILVYNGDTAYAESEQRRMEDVFNGKREQTGEDTTKGRLLVATLAKSKVGISLHDTVGNAPRDVYIIAKPGAPTDIIQMEGREIRFGVKSNVRYFYLDSYTSQSMSNWASTFSKTYLAEAMALGNDARQLFADVLVETYKAGKNNDFLSFNAAKDKVDTGGNAIDNVKSLDDLRKVINQLSIPEESKAKLTEELNGIEDKQVRKQIITPENESMVVKQLNTLFGRVGGKIILQGDHKYFVKIPGGNTLEFDLSRTSEEILNAANEKTKAQMKANAGIAANANNLVVRGLYTGKDLIFITDAVKENTCPHEVGHFVWSLLSNNDKERLVRYFAKKGNLTGNNIAARAEEMFCDDFANFFIKSNKDEQAGKRVVTKTALQKIYDKLRRFLLAMAEKFGLKSHPSTEDALDKLRNSGKEIDLTQENIEALYLRILNGDIYNRGGINENELKNRAQLIDERQAERDIGTRVVMMKARRMFAEGVPAIDVWHETNCIQMLDGSIMMYIPMKSSDFIFGKKEINELKRKLNGQKDDGVELNLSEIIRPNHPLFRLIPKLKHTKVIISAPLFANYDGGYTEEHNTITIPLEDLSQLSSTKEDALSVHVQTVLAHEIQHAIQFDFKNVKYKPKELLTENDVKRYLENYRNDITERQAYLASTMLISETNKDRNAKKGDDYANNAIAKDAIVLQKVLRDKISALKESNIKTTPEFDSSLEDLLYWIDKTVDGIVGQSSVPSEQLSLLESDFRKILSREKSKDDIENILDTTERAIPPDRQTLYNVHGKKFRYLLSLLETDFFMAVGKNLNQAIVIPMPDVEALEKDAVYPGKAQLSEVNARSVDINDIDTDNVRVSIRPVSMIGNNVDPHEIRFQVESADKKADKKAVETGILKPNNEKITRDGIDVYPEGIDKGPQPKAGETDQQYIYRVLAWKRQKLIEGEENKASILDLLKSPSRLAEKFPTLFKPIYEIWHKAYQYQERLRTEWFGDFKTALDNLKSTTDFEQHNALLIEGDVNQVEFTKEELQKRGYSDKVIAAYFATRKLMAKIYDSVNNTHRRMKSKNRENVSYKEVLELIDRRNRYFYDEVLIKNDNGEMVPWRKAKLNPKKKYDVSYKYALVFKEAELDVTMDRIEELKESGLARHIVFTHSPDAKGSKVKRYNVTYEATVPPMGNRKGYVPHMFDHWFVGIEGEDGNYIIKSSQPTMAKAVEVAGQMKKADGGKYKYVVFPKLFNPDAAFGLEEPNSGTARGDIIATASEERAFIRNVQKKYGVTLEEAETIVKSGVRRTNMNRLYANGLYRKGVEGWNQDMIDAISRYVVASSRYVALQDAKHDSIDMYEKLYGRAFGDDVRVADDPLASIVKRYILDCNGTPSAMEQWLNRTLNSWALWRDHISASYGERSILALASKANQVVSICKLGFFNISSAMVNLLQLANTYAFVGNKYFMEGIKAYRNMSDLDKRIIRETNVEYDIGMDTVMSYTKRRSSNKKVNAANNYLGKIRVALAQLGEKGMFLFKKSDAIDRQITVLAAYRKGIADGMTDSEAIKYAEQINIKCNFDYGVSDAPAFMRAMSGTGIGEMMLLFQKYPIKEFELMVEMVKKATGKEGQSGKREALRFWGMYFIMSGMSGLPGLDLWDEWLEMMFGIKPSKAAKLYMFNEFGDNAMTRALAYGVGAVAGIDVSRRVGLADMIPSHDSVLAYLTGPTGSTVRELCSATQDAVKSGDPDYARIMKAISPALGNLFEVGRGYKTNQKGKIISTYEGTDALIKAIGFRPAEESIASDLATALYSEQSSYLDGRQRLVLRMAQKLNNGEHLSQDDRDMLREFKVTSQQIHTARKQMRMNAAQRAKANMTKRQKKLYNKVLNDNGEGD